MIGDRVAGRFVIEAPLGGGGMGRVWRARDRTLDRTVALKQIRPDMGPVPELAARARREAQALARVDHSGIVRVHDILDTQDGPWIVMDYVRGDALGTLIDRSPLPELEAARVGARVLDALTAAHAVGVYHRDVKPDNILITTSGEVVLVDFGIAAIEGQSSLTTLGRLVGTPDFMAPERLHGDPAGAAADLWSLGATLYTALEGRPPFRRSNDAAVRFAILRADPDPLLRSHRLASTIGRLLDKNPGTRMTAAELAHDLNRLLEPPRSPRNGDRPPRSGRNPAGGGPVRRDPSAGQAGRNPAGNGPARNDPSDGEAGRTPAEGGPVRRDPPADRAGSNQGGGGAVRRGVPPPRGPAVGNARRSVAHQGEKLLAVPAADAASALGERWQEFTADAVEEMCRQAAKSAKILQMLLPRRACRLLDQVRDPALVAGVVLAMDTRHRGHILGGMHDRNSAAAIGAMAATDPRRTGLAVAAMPEDPAVRALNRLSPATIANVLTHCPHSTRDHLLSRLPDTTREAVKRRLTG
ncbi:serine/threonine protein kinase [Nonomuraea terrae]|uniref:non-specific serine/threonine protein kinase n=1 Tax=Nonomuraea terrae TaxID=2530383 RepID=A0A4R4YWR3_9ACTN|nr:serine/threonine-protein kinase [Nonomuraea terrae]TDD49833.1 serine/threonine protein kinase [Nonomuraea terrae]